MKPFGRLLTHPASIIAMLYLLLNYVLISITHTVWGQLTGYPVAMQFSLLTFAIIIIIRSFGWEQLRNELPFVRLRDTWQRWLLALIPVAVFIGVPAYLQVTQFGLPALPEGRALFGTISLAFAMALHGELIWRGVVARGLLDHFGPLMASLLSGAVFGMAVAWLDYLANGAFLLALDKGLAFAALGVFFTGVYFLSRAMWLTVLLHTATLLFLALVPAATPSFESLAQVQDTFRETLVVMLPLFVYLLVVLRRTHEAIRADFAADAA